MPLNHFPGENVRLKGKFLNDQILNANMIGNLIDHEICTEIGN
jgi:hypothetical protein